MNAIFRYAFGAAGVMRDLHARSGQAVDVVRPLLQDGSEADDPDDVGYWYLARFSDGQEVHAQPDELLDPDTGVSWADFQELPMIDIGEQ